MNKDLQKFDYVSFKIKDDILMAYYDDVQITLDIAKYIVKHRLEYQDHKKFPTIAHGSGILSATKDARDYFAVEGNEGMVSLAIIMPNTFGRVIGNFYLKVSQPNIPTQLFSTEEEAIKWSHQFIQ